MNWFYTCSCHHDETSSLTAQQIKITFNGDAPANMPSKLRQFAAKVKPSINPETAVNSGFQQ
jgi:hypothetical protein